MVDIVTLVVAVVEVVAAGSGKCRAFLFFREGSKSSFDRFSMRAEVVVVVVVVEVQEGGGDV